MAIHIKPENEGKFTARAHSQGRSVQGQASHDLHSKSASSAAKQEANFARMAKRHWKPLGRKSSRH